MLKYGTIATCVQGTSSLINLLWLVILLTVTVTANQRGDHDDKPALWQNCDVFMAPTNTSAGWGVFAARDFEQQELLDIPAFYIPFNKTERMLSSSDHRMLHESSLDDYVYRIHRRHVDRSQTLVLFGYDMMFNHHPTDFNVQLGMGLGYSQGFYTKRKIQAGEQLLSSYGHKDGGKHWFESRGLTMRSDKSDIESSSPDQLDFLRSRYCTKIYAGPGPSNFRQLIPPFDESRIAPFDAGVYDARAKLPIKAGEQIEQGPAMLLYKPFVKDTALGPLVISWTDLHQEHQDSVRSASAAIGGKLPIQYRGEASKWKRIRRMASLENVAILPFAGRIGLVRRVVVNPDSEDLGQLVGGEVASMATKSNCRLEIEISVTSPDVDGGAPPPRRADEQTPEVSVVLTLIATEDIDVGELLLMDLKPGGTVNEYELLKLKLSETGHGLSLG